VSDERSLRLTVFRVDVRENLEVAARAERLHHGNSIVLISDPLVDELLADWSRPVRLRAERRRYPNEAIVELTIREEV